MKLIRGGLVLRSACWLLRARHKRGVTSTWTVTNDYDFRGNSQVGQRPRHPGEPRLRSRQRLVRRRMGQQHRLRVPSGGPARESGHRARPVRRLHQDARVGLRVRRRSRRLHLSAREPTSSTKRCTRSIAKDWFKAKLWYSPEFGGKAAKDLSRQRGHGSGVGLAPRSECDGPVAAKLLDPRARRLQHRRLLGRRVRRRPRSTTRSASATRPASSISA